MLQEVFNAVGTVTAVSIKRDKKTGQNLGYGFVKMASHSGQVKVCGGWRGEVHANRAAPPLPNPDAVHAKEKIQNMDVGGRRIRVGWAMKGNGGGSSN